VEVPDQVARQVVLGHSRIELSVQAVGNR
jgi:hypothetical protein